MLNRYRQTRMRVCLVLLWGCAGVTFAQEAPKAKEKADKQGDTNPTFVFNYSSVFDNYIPFDEVPEIGWVEANDNVGQIGGWRAYAKLVQEEAKKKAEQEQQQKGSDQK